MRAIGLMVGVLLCAAPVGAAAQTAGEVDVRLTGRVQVQYNTTSADEAGPDALPSSTFETRRVRLGVWIEADDWITAIIEPEYALGELHLQQAWVNLGFSDAAQLRIGQFKKPFSTIFLESSTEIAAIERGLRIRGLESALETADEDAADPVLTPFAGGPLVGEEQYIIDALGYQSYDLGAALHGSLGRFTYELGLFNGAGPDTRDDNDAKTVVGRLSASPLADVPLTIGIAATHHPRFAAAAETDGSALELFGRWGAFRQPGVRAIVEVVTGETLGVDDSFLAAQGVAAYFHPVSGRVEGLEPVARVSWGDPRRDVDGDAGVLLTPGFNVYFSGRNRLMLDYDVWVPQADHFETTHALRAQAQVYF